MSTVSRFLGFEVGPIRPPSEAKSLLIRVTRNCQWNRCTFCPVYKNKEFSMRPIDDVISDIDLLSKHVAKLRETFDSPKLLSREVLWTLTNEIDPKELPAWDYALKWFADGMQSVFLQDADSLVVGPDVLEKILTHLLDQFPWIERITSYSRSSTILKVGEEGLTKLKDAGLDRIHVGLESGSNEVLRLVKKGATKEMHIQAGKMIKGIGFELSEYVMPGLGGKKHSNIHAIETADALNQINADFIRLRPLAITSRAPLCLELEHGNFVKLNDIEIAQELKIFIERLDGISSIILSDHILNLFADLEGKLPDYKERMLGIINAFLNLDSQQKLLFRLGRRIGLLQSLDDMYSQRKIERVQEIAISQNISEMNIDTVIDRLMEQFI
ncbi:radical SAM protein [Candidatus Thorarchaeota archaeon]|nr:MAG: radical SAM protein [Candidatus Thorarchaeota archaeon]